MAIWLAVALAAAVFPPDDGDGLPRSLQTDPDWRAVEGVVAARMGVWTGHGFEFSAVRTDNTEAKSQQATFFTASLLAGVQFHEHVVILGSFEGDVASKVTVQVGGVYVGWREHPKQRYGKGVPDEVMIYAGAILGSLEVHKDDFGDFDSGVGFAGGVAMGWMISSQLSFQLYGEYRLIEFDYKREIVSGDDSIGGSTVLLAVGIDLRF
jgi:hypothetical protein